MTDTTLVSRVTVRDVLFGSGADAQNELVRRLRAADTLSAAREALRVGGESMWDGAHEQLAGIAADFLDLDIATVAMNGWRKHVALLDAATRTKADGSTAVVPLGGRDLRLVRRPHVDVQLGAMTLPAIRFEVSVDITAVVVAGVVRGGRLVALTDGRCDVTVSLSAAGTLLAKATRSADPHVSVPLGDGLALGGPPRR